MTVELQSASETNATQAPTSVFEESLTYADWDSDYYTPISIRFYDMAFRWMFRKMRIPAGTLVLDAGCGPGVHTIRAAAMGYNVHAIDVSATAVEEAKRRVARAGLTGRVRFDQADLTQLPFADQSFETIFSWGVIIHIPEAGKAVRELARILKPGGKLALYVSNASAWDLKLERLARFVTLRPRLELIERDLGLGCWYSMHDARLWLWRFNIGQLVKCCSAAGLRHTARVAGEFTEIQRRCRGFVRNLLLRANNGWFRWRLPAAPATANLLLFEKPEFHSVRRAGGCHGHERSSENDSGKGA